MWGERKNQLSHSSLRVPPRGEGLPNVHQAQSRGGASVGLQTLAPRPSPHSEGLVTAAPETSVSWPAFRKNGQACTGKAQCEE